MPIFFSLYKDFLKKDMFFYYTDQVSKVMMIPSLYQTVSPLRWQSELFPAFEKTIHFL